MLFFFDLVNSPINGSQVKRVMDLSVGTILKILYSVFLMGTFCTMIGMENEAHFVEYQDWDWFKQVEIENQYLTVVTASSVGYGHKLHESGVLFRVPLILIM